MFFHFPKPSPQEMALSFSNSKDIIKDHYTNLTLHPLVENPSTFSSSGISSEKITALFFKKLKLNLEQDKQIISPIISLNKKIPETKTDRSTAEKKFRKNNNSNNRNTTTTNNNNNKNNNKVILYNRTQKKNHQMIQ